MKEDFLNNKELNEIANEVYKDNPKATLWDVILSVLSESGDIDKFVIWIMSDLPVIELVAKGQSVDYISEFLEIPSVEVERTCRIWGLRYFDETLDFDPLMVYNEGMTAEQMKSKLQPVTYGSVSNYDLDACVNNVKKYIAIKQLLDEWESDRNNVN